VLGALVGVTVGVIDIVGVIEGVIEIVGVTEGVTEIVSVTVGVSVGVKLIVGETVGVGVGVKGVKSYSISRHKEFSFVFGSIPEEEKYLPAGGIPGSEGSGGYVPLAG
jgi:hypothetical protein